MRILAIETSCDETAIAILEDQDRKVKIKSNIVSSQVKIHKKWGGVVPTIAKREHQKNLVLVLEKALKQAGLLKRVQNLEYRIQESKFKKLKEILIREEVLYKRLENFLKSYKEPKIDLIAVTVGPGLEPALWVGVNFAKALAYFWEKKIIPVNHIEAHILTNFLNKKYIKTKGLFLAICLVVSGGHTQLILMQDIGKYKLLGETRDDAAGECFDKVAKILGLGYPGGPIISQLSQKTDRGPSSISLPRPMINQKNYDFSFSGLKTAVLYNYKNQQAKIRKSKKYIRAISIETQQAIIDVLIKKTIMATKDYKAKTIILGGGVVANRELRKQFRERIRKENPNIKYLVPDIKFCTDNAAMTAIAAYFHQSKKTKDWEKIKANANIKV